MRIIQNSKILPFCEISLVLNRFFKKPSNEDLNVKLALHDMHPTSKMKRLEQFIMSFRWIGFSGDIKNGELQDGEYWQCPNHGIALTKECLQATHLQQSKTLSKMFNYYSLLPPTNKRSYRRRTDLPMGFS
jgi:hypothetical protein